MSMTIVRNGHGTPIALRTNLKRDPLCSDANESESRWIVRATAGINDFTLFGQQKRRIAPPSLGGDFAQPYARTSSALLYIRSKGDAGSAHGTEGIGIPGAVISIPRVGSAAITIKLPLIHIIRTGGRTVSFYIIFGAAVSNRTIPGLNGLSETCETRC